MTEYKTEIVFDLTSPIEYHSKGQIEQSYQLILQAPSNKVGRQCNQLKQGFKRAVKNIMTDFASFDNEKREQASSVDEHPLTAEQILEFLQMSNIDYADYVDVFRSLMTNKIAQVAEGVFLTNPMFDSLSIDDTDKMLGEYLENFLLSSSKKMSQSK